MTTNLVATVATAQAIVLAALVQELTPPRGQYMADLTDREILAWTALRYVAEQQGGRVGIEDILGCASLFGLSKPDTLVIANVLRNTLLEAQS